MPGHETGSWGGKTCNPLARVSQVNATSPAISELRRPAARESRAHVTRNGDRPTLSPSMGDGFCRCAILLPCVARVSPRFSSRCSPSRAPPSDRRAESLDRRRSPRSSGNTAARGRCQSRVRSLRDRARSRPLDSSPSLRCASKPGTRRLVTRSFNVLRLLSCRSAVVSVVGLRRRAA
jgi:hypothetical protein